MSDSYLKGLREGEFKAVQPLLPRPPARVLEMGAGPGWQTRMLKEAGYQVTAADVATNAFNPEAEEVITYSGDKFPFQDGAFDFVFISNVFDHVHNRELFASEVRRVTTSKGLWVVVAPTCTWRLWTLLFHLLSLPMRYLRRRQTSPTATASPKEVAKTNGGLVARLFPRLGEHGNAFSELIAFSDGARRRFFAALGWKVREARPTYIYYSGARLLGLHLSVASRSAAARILGSSCRIYVLEKANG